MYGREPFALYQKILAKLRQFYWRYQLGYMGEGCFIYSDVVVFYPGKMKMGQNSSIANFSHIWAGGGITIGDNVLIASHVVITSQSHDATAREVGELYRSTKRDQSINIGSNVWIGANAIVFPGVSIGDNSIVGAGSVVTKSIPANVVVAGNPARIIRELS